MIDRIRSRRAFDRLRREGTRVRVDPLWCSFVLDPEISPPRVAFAIGRTVGPAVARNRLRRRLRAILAATSELRPGLYLIGTRPAVLELTFGELRDRVGRLVGDCGP